LITIAKVRALHYPRKLRETNSKRLDSITPVLEDHTDSDSVRLLLLDFETRSKTQPPRHHAIHQEVYQGGDSDAPTFRPTVEKAIRGSPQTWGRTGPAHLPAVKGKTLREGFQLVPRHP